MALPTDVGRLTGRMRTCDTMAMQFSPLYLVLFIFALTFLVTVVQLGIISVAFDKLGLSPDAGLLLLVASLAGSVINLPVMSVPSAPSPPPSSPWGYRGLLRPRLGFTGYTLIAVNVGGGLIPLLFSVYLMVHSPLDILELGAGIGLVTFVAYLTSRPVPGRGIGIPILVAPVTAAALALLLDPQHSAPLAYVSGTLGVLIGADLLRLRDVRRLGVPVASIGGAGTFDGIFITGIVAVLLA